MTTTRLSAATLDLSRYPAPLAIRDLDYDAMLDNRMARLKVLFAEKGLPYNVEKLESDPAKFLQRVDNYRELLTDQRINDAVKAVMIAFAVKSDLDHMAARFGVQRKVIAPATETTDVVMESDEELRRRALIAPEAFAAAGPYGAWVYHGLTSDPRVLNVDVWKTGPGALSVAVQSRVGDGVPDNDTVAAVRAYLRRDDIMPLTDMLSVFPVTNHAFAIQLTAYVLPGPDKTLVKENIENSLAALVFSRRTPARDMPLSAIFAAAHIGAVDKVTIASPATDIARGYGEVPLCTGIDVTVLEHDG